ncbi:unnamed protein product [Polarella glacialis]|uniref:Uncharacterized protein n=1 Tax=Polarella glacialis TaxID=89957 RepID=A0A813I611_POLGL|nr:unnamed protein product [Polarella glacialis]
MAPDCLAEPPARLEIHEQQSGAKHRKVELYVARGVLRRIPFFAPQISEGELGGESLQLRLAEGCSAVAAELLFRRLYVREATWPTTVLVALAVQVCELASMLLMEDMQDELVDLVGRSIRTEADDKVLTDWCSQREGHPGLAKLAKDIASGGFATDIDVELELMLANAVDHVNHSAAFAAAKKIFKKRGIQGEQMLKQHLDIVIKLLEKKKLFFRQHIPIACACRHSTVLRICSVVWY